MNYRKLLSMILLVFTVMLTDFAFAEVPSLQVTTKGSDLIVTENYNQNDGKIESGNFTLYRDVTTVGDLKDHLNKDPNAEWSVVDVYGGTIEDDAKLKYYGEEKPYVKDYCCRLKVFYGDVATPTDYSVYYIFLEEPILNEIKSKSMPEPNSLWDCLDVGQSFFTEEYYIKSGVYGKKITPLTSVGEFFSCIEKKDSRATWVLKNDLGVEKSETDNLEYGDILAVTGTAGTNEYHISVEFEHLVYSIVTDIDYTLGKVSSGSEKITEAMTVGELKSNLIIIKGANIEVYHGEKLLNDGDFLTDGDALKISGKLPDALGELTIDTAEEYTVNAESAYDISFDLNGGTGTIPENIKVAEGENSQELPDSTGITPPEGYTFGGWNTAADGSGTSYKAGDTLNMGTSNITLYAKWTANPKYKVTYDGNGNTEGTVPNDDNSYYAGSEFTVKAKPSDLKRPGYNFEYWNTKADGKGSVAGPSTRYKIGNSDLTLYATWKPLTYQIIYHDDGKTTGVAPSTGYFKMDSKATIADNSGFLEKDGFNFAGWNTSPDGTGKDYAPKYEFTMGYENLNLYPKWTELPSYTVTFDSQGGSAIDQLLDVLEGSKISEPALPTLEGNRFEGWYKEAECTNEWNFSTDIVTGETILYAKWVKSATNSILSFRFEELTPTVTASVYEETGEISALVPWGTDIRNLEPTIMHNGASITPESNVPKDFSSPVTYTVTASNGDTKEYRAEVDVASPDIPNPPEGVRAKGYDEGVFLEWEGMDGVTGYELYRGISSGAYDETIGVSESVYNHKFDGLENGKDYFFAIKALRDSSKSIFSEEVSARPMGLPSPPENIKAVAGDGEARISFDISIDDGGSEISKYVVVSDPDNIEINTETNSAVVKGLKNGVSYTFTVKAVNEVGESFSSKASNRVTPYSSSSDDSDDDSGSSHDSGKSDRNHGSDKVALEVNGEKKENLAETQTETKNGHKITTISVDEKKLEAKLEQEGQGSKVTFPVENKEGTVVGELNGQMVKDMEVKEAILDVRTSKAEYILPAEEIHIDKVSEQFGRQVKLEDIKIHLEIGETLEQMVEVVEDAASEGHFNLVVPPVDFTVTCINGEKSVEVKEFNHYVERMIAIPEGADPHKITTGLIMYKDGTTCHVPTQIIQVDGRYFAKINSLTNSTYSVIWNPKDYQDVKGHWAEEVCNEMGARKVVAESAGNKFTPDKDVTRLMFTQTLVRALGLGEKGEEDKFGDVDRSDGYFGAVATALEHDLVSGYEDNTFRAGNSVTREEAAALIVRAMKIAGLKVDYTGAELDSVLDQFKDKEEIAEWAREVVAICVKDGMIVGNENSEFMPKENMTKAQLAAIMMRMLETADLI